MIVPHDQRIKIRNLRLEPDCQVQTEDRELHEGLKFFLPDPLESGRNYKKLSVLFEKTFLKAK